MYLKKMVCDPLMKKKKKLLRLRGRVEGHTQQNTKRKSGRCQKSITWRFSEVVVADWKDSG